MYAVIGDLVGSRRLSDRAAAQDRVGAVLAEVDGWSGGLQRLEPTLGDEVQGALTTLGEASRAVLVIRPDRLGERGCRMLRLSLRGETQQRIAEAEGITKSAVSQQFARGIGAVRDAQGLLDG